MEIILYTLPTFCPRCNMIKTRLEEKHLTYEEIQSPEELEKMGFDIAPAVKIDGKVYGFSAALSWIKSQEDPTK